MKNQIEGFTKADFIALSDVAGFVYESICVALASKVPPEAQKELVELQKGTDTIALEKCIARFVPDPYVFIQEETRAAFDLLRQLEKTHQ